MASIRELSRGDVETFLAERPLSSRGQRAFMVALLDLSTGTAAPEVGPEQLRDELGRRSGGAISAAAFRKQLSRVNDSLSAAAAPFTLVTRGSRIAVVPTEHWNRSSQLDSVQRALVSHSGERMRENLDSFVSPRAMPDRLLVMWSYAWLPREQQAIQLEIFQLLKAKLAHPPARYRHLPQIELWRDEERINLAQAGTPQMDEACAGAFLGLLVLSDKYPASEACMREADYFLTDEGENRPDKGCIVLRFNCAIDDIDQRFRKRIVFPSGGEGHLLHQWAKGDADDRDQLIGDIAKQILENADRRYRQASLGTTTPAEPDRSRGKSRVERYLAAQPERMRHDDAHSTTPLARAGADGYDVANSANAPDINGVDIVERLIDWAASSDASRPRVVALLGDFGMGKTVTCQLVCRRMVERSETLPGLPTPVYFDLRDIPKPERPEHLTLESLMGDLLRKTGETALSASEVIEFIRQRKALVIFDGLDEITNKYSVDVARIIYRQLISIVPAEVWNDDAQRRGVLKKSGATSERSREGPSILLSCRSQYFSDFASERGFLSDADRSGLRLHEDISVYVMLPFNPDQIRDYVARNLPADEHERAMSLIENTYDLGELARRPILLRYIGELVHRLEEEKLAGRAINLSRLYDILISQTFERDGGKHVIPIADKKRLLEALALHLHRRQSEDIPNEKLVEWLDDEIGANFPKLAAALKGEEGLKLSEVFVQDLRNATLLSRPGESAFRFGHTSLREYFLAGALYRAALRRAPLECWDIALPSSETLDFLLQRHTIEEATERRLFVDQFVGLLSPGQPKAVRRLGFTIWLRSLEGSDPLPRPAVLDCSDFELGESELKGRAGSPLPLSNSIWCDTDLHQALLEHIDLSGADFDGVDATAARFVQCHLAGAHFRGARLNGTLWRNCSLDAETLAGASLDLAEAYECRIDGRAWRPQPPPPREARFWQLRSRFHGKPAALLTVEVDGRSALATTDSRAIQIIDADTGTLLRNLESGASGVRMMACSAPVQGALIAALTGENTIEIWDVAGGRIIRKLEAKHPSIAGLAFSETDTLIAADAGGRLRVWDLNSDKEPRTFEVDEETVSAMAATPGGALAFIDSRGDVQLFDLAAGQTVRTFVSDHGVDAIACGIVQGRPWIAGSGSDGSVYAWDLETGAIVHKFLGSGGRNRPGRLRTSMRLIRRLGPLLGFMTVEGRLVLYSTVRGGEIKVWDAASGAALPALRVSTESGGAAAFARIDDRPVLALAVSKGFVHIVDLKGKRLRTFGKRLLNADAVAALSFDGRCLIAGGGDEGTVRLWDAATGECLHRFETEDPTGINALAFAVVDGAPMLISGDSEFLHLYDVGSGTAVHKLAGHDDWVRSVAFATIAGRPTLISGGDDDNVRFWDARTGEAVGLCEGHSDWVNEVAVATLEGQPMILSASDDGTVRLWDGRTGEEVRVFRHEDTCVLSVAFAIVNGEPTMASVDMDDVIRFWSLASGKMLRRFETQLDTSDSASLAFVEIDDRMLVGVGGNDGVVRYWDAGTGEPEESLSRRSEILGPFAAIRDGDGEMIVGRDDYGNIVATRITMAGPQQTSIFSLREGTAITVRHGELGHQILLAAPDAWKHYVAAYVAGDRHFVTGIDDMPVAD